jgi:PAS domain-containing protein
MAENRKSRRTRTLRGGKILFNDKSSVVDCVVRNLSSEGGCLQVETALGIPGSFELLIEDEQRRSCVLVWKSENRIGVSFRQPLQTVDANSTGEQEEVIDPALHRQQQDIVEFARGDLVRSELIRLRAALDEIQVGIVLLDKGLRAQFINRMFRQIWELPDAKADSKPAFTLMHHGRDTFAYQVPEDELDAYIEDRVGHVKLGNAAPRDLRLRNGEVLRFQCAPLPDGGRMLTYTFVTDIVRRSDEVEAAGARRDG